MSSSSSYGILVLRISQSRTPKAQTSLASVLCKTRPAASFRPSPVLAARRLGRRRAISSGCCQPSVERSKPGTGRSRSGALQATGTKTLAGPPFASRSESSQRRSGNGAEAPSHAAATTVDLAFVRPLLLSVGCACLRAAFCASPKSASLLTTTGSPSTRIWVTKQTFREAMSRCKMSFECRYATASAICSDHMMTSPLGTRLLLAWSPRRWSSRLPCSASSSKAQKSDDPGGLVHARHLRT